jgi:hypothetical protein
MSTNSKKESGMPFEIKDLKPNEEWFDPVGIRFFVNATKTNIKLGFSHNIRTVEIIAILNTDKEDAKNPKIKVLEGEIIEEEV